MIFLNLGLFLLIGWGTWWLTGIDKTYGGESKRGHFVTRALRCTAVIFLSAVFIALIENPMGIIGLPVIFVLAIGIGFILRSSIAELVTGGFIRLLDPALHDTRPFDPGKSQRCQDAIARLIHSGQRKEAIKLCEELKQSGDVDIVSLEQTLEFLGVPQNTVTHAARLRVEKKFGEAEQVLKTVLAKDPANIAAAMMLMRLYARDLRQPAQAHAVLRALEKQPQVAERHLESARHKIVEWSHQRVAPAEPGAPPPEKPESVDELLAQGFFGTAVERLEQQVKAHPTDFDSHLRLAEVHAKFCKNFHRAKKLVRHMERSNFTPEQLEAARAKLADWEKTAISRQRTH